MNGYKEEIYKNYRSYHNDLLYGRPTLDSFKKNFSSWNYYYAKFLPLNRKAKLLDIGCGEGGFVYFLNKIGYSNVSGVDLSEEQIRLGQGLGIAGLQLADLREFLNSKKETFDCIIARDVIEHFTRQEAFDIVNQVNSALKPEGVFIMQVPNGEGINMSSIFYGDYTHEVAYSHLSARQLFLNTGFSEVASHPLGPVPHSLKGTVRYVLWKMREAFHRFWKVVETGNARGIFTSNLIAVGKK